MSGDYRKKGKILSAGDKAEGTFGWGEVSDKLPSYTKNGSTETNWYFYKSADDTTLRRCKGYDTCNHDGQDCSCDIRDYSVIYRKEDD